MRSHIIQLAIRKLLEQTPDLVVVAEALNTGDALRLAAEKRPHVILSGDSWPELNPVDLARRLRDELHLPVPIVMLRPSPDVRFLDDIMQSPVAGILGLETTLDELVAALRAARYGFTVLSGGARESVRSVLASAHSIAEDADTPLPLTQRERQVLELMMEGRMNKEISACMGVALRTVEMHVANINGKLGASSRTEAVVKAMRLTGGHTKACEQPQTEISVLTTRRLSRQARY